MRRATSKIPLHCCLTTNFYPRSPCGERLTALHNILKLFSFLSTLSLRRATCAASITPAPSRNFYPRSPCGERQPSKTRRLTNKMISIHALLAESDPHKQNKRRHTPYFYPRSPCGERQNARPETRQHGAISIHALLAESDHAPSHNLYLRNNFYPRSPCGERRDVVYNWLPYAKFLSTLSLRRATQC